MISPKGWRAISPVNSAITTGTVRSLRLDGGEGQREQIFVPCGDERQQAVVTSAGP
jgi:hypothetical protein